MGKNAGEVVAVARGDGRMTVIFWGRSGLLIMSQAYWLLSFAPVSTRPRSWTAEIDGDDMATKLEHLAQVKFIPIFGPCVPPIPGLGFLSRVEGKSLYQRG